MAQPDSLRELAFKVWERLLHVPYKWAGDDPMEGVDCSGFVLEGLKAAGIVAPDFDTTAEDLLTATFARRALVTEVEKLRRGMLVFWGKPARHVEVIVGSYPATEGLRVITIGASGGGSSTVDAASAAQQNAYVKLRPLAKGWVAALDPFA